MNMPRRKTLATIIRIVIVVACLTFLVAHARDIAMAAPAGRWLTVDMFWFAGLAAPVFGATAFFMVAGWHRLLCFLGYRLSPRALAGALCLTQIAKYLPGNIGHHVGRVTLAHRTLGLPVSVGVISLLQESSLACLAAVLVALACVCFQPLPLSAALGLELDSRWVLLAVAFVGLAALALINQARHFAIFNRPRRLQWVLRIAPSWRATFTAIPFYVATYAISGVALLIVSIPLLPDVMAAWLPLTSAYALSWMVGFVVPGAPGGLGVREAVLVMLLDGMYPGDAVLAIALLSRLSLIVADVLIFLTGLALRHVPAAPAAPLEPQ